MHTPYPSRPLLGLEHSTGALVLVDEWRHSLILSAADNLYLKIYHVLILEDLFPLVYDALRALPFRMRPKCQRVE